MRRFKLLVPAQPDWAAKLKGDTVDIPLWAVIEEADGTEAVVGLISQGRELVVASDAQGFEGYERAGIKMSRRDIAQGGIARLLGQ